MDQERNPNKNAELSMEQNYNQIDMNRSDVDIIVNACDAG